MIITKKLFAIVLCVYLVFCITACTEPAESNNTTITAPTQSSVETKTLYLPLSVKHYVQNYSINGTAVNPESLELSYTVEYRYDENNILTEVATIQNGQATRQVFTTCDEHGNVIKTREVSAGNDNVVENTYTRDAQGRVVHRETYSGGRFSYAVDLLWDDQGNLIKQDDGISMSEFTYDDKGQQFSYRHYWNGVLNDYMQTTLDAEDRLATYSRYDAEGNQIYYIEYTYEPNTREEAHSYSINDPLPQYYRYIYDENGNLVQVDRWGVTIGQPTSAFYTYLAIEVPVDSIRQSYEP